MLIPLEESSSLLRAGNRTGAGPLRRMGGKDGEEVVLYETMQLKHVESCCGAGDRRVESLWVQIRGEAKKAGTS